MQGSALLWLRQRLECADKGSNGGTGGGFDQRRQGQYRAMAGMAQRIAMGGGI